MTAPLSTAENARLLGWVEHMLRSPLWSDRERAFLIAVRGQHKRRPGMVLSERQAPWLADLVARFLADNLGEVGVVDGEGRDYA